MKLLNSSLLIAFLFIGTAAFSQRGLTMDENTVSVVIDGSTTRMELIEIRTALQEKGIDFRYAFQVEDQVDGPAKLSSIDFTLAVTNGDCNGSGNHPSMQTPGAKVSFTVNRQNGNCAITIN
jgi:hypothetical protein